MSLLTLFSSPKPFTDPKVAVIQANAIGSWVRLPDVQVLLMGDEVGLSRVALESGAIHVPDVATNAAGTPLVSSMVQRARESGDGGTLCIINADMILMSDFVEVARRAQRIGEAFVVVSRRWDLDVDSPLDFTAGWEAELRAVVLQRGELHRPAGSDFFLFPKACYAELPDFAVGRAGWDNWMIYNARRRSWPVIDATPSVMIVHQNHDYSHLPGGQPHYSAPETDENIRLAGGEAAVRYTILDATRVLRDGKLVRPQLTYLRFMRRLELFLRALFFFLPPEMIEEVARPKRWKKRIRRLLGVGGAEPGNHA
jgi:hypothetical protein